MYRMIEVVSSQYCHCCFCTMCQRPLYCIVRHRLILCSVCIFAAVNEQTRLLNETVWIIEWRLFVVLCVCVYVLGHRQNGMRLMKTNYSDDVTYSGKHVLRECDRFRFKFFFYIVVVVWLVVWFVVYFFVCVCCFWNMVTQHDMAIKYVLHRNRVCKRCASVHARITVQYSWILNILRMCEGVEIYR